MNMKTSPMSLVASTLTVLAHLAAATDEAVATRNFTLINKCKFDVSVYSQTGNGMHDEHFMLPKGTTGKTTTFDAASEPDQEQDYSSPPGLNLQIGPGNVNPEWSNINFNQTALISLSFTAVSFYRAVGPSQPETGFNFTKIAINPDSSSGCKSMVWLPKAEIHTQTCQAKNVALEGVLCPE